MTNNYVSRVLMFSLLFLISVSLISSYSGSFSTLPKDFEPVFGYYHPFGSGNDSEGNRGRINLWNDDGDTYVYEPWSGEWILYQEEHKIRDELPANFKPVVGYYHPFGNGQDQFGNKGRINIWGEDGSAYVFEPWTRKWILYQEEHKIRDGLPVNFKPVVAYYVLTSNGGRIHVWDKDGNTYIFNPNQRNWILYQEVHKIRDGLPANFKPVSGYAFENNGKGVIHLWDKDGNLFAFNPNNLVFEDLTNDLKDMGLPEEEYPNAGYYDPFQEKLILWYGKTIYGSSDFEEFEQIGNGKKNDRDTSNNFYNTNDELEYLNLINSKKNSNPLVISFNEDDNQVVTSVKEKDNSMFWLWTIVILNVALFLILIIVLLILRR